MITVQQREARRFWIQELRSGKYPQTQGTLRRLEPRVDLNSGAIWREVGYCCMGVAAENCPGVVASPRTSHMMYDDHAARLPDRAADWLGLTLDDPFILYEGESIRLSQLNDTLRLTLPEIADVIEAQADDWDGLDISIG
jgi:hypothetical protein